MTKENQSKTNVWPVTVVESSYNMVEAEPRVRSPLRKKNRNQKKDHVDVVFVTQDKYRCAHGIEVQATPKERMLDVYAGQGLAKF
jgi:hypothetical protein